MCSLPDLEVMGAIRRVNGGDPEYATALLHTVPLVIRVISRPNAAGKSRKTYRLDKGPRGP